MDLLRFPEYWVGGYRQRSDTRIFPVLSEDYDRGIVPLELVDSRFYHLDIYFCPLRRWLAPEFLLLSMAAVAHSRRGALMNAYSTRTSYDLR